MRRASSVLTPEAARRERFESILNSGQQAILEISMSLWRTTLTAGAALAALATASALTPSSAVAQAQKRPNIVMLMTDDTGWNDFGPNSNGGKALGHPTPNVDQIAEEGATFTNWYGQASCRPAAPRSSPAAFRFARRSR